jgi:N-acetyl-anhydromuramyl-L-alanine amidase AmpD
MLIPHCLRSVLTLLACSAFFAACTSTPTHRHSFLPLNAPDTPPDVRSLELTRTGDEIVIAGHFFHTGAPVVLWIDPGGYDAYRTEKRFAPYDQAPWHHASDNPAAKTKGGEGVETPWRFSQRYQSSATSTFTSAQLDQIRGGGWDLDLLRSKVDQLVFHYDVCGTSQQCFRVLQDMRGLSVHFMLDIDGTIYQTLDVKERAWHATTSNDRSIGVEIANIGAYPAPPHQEHATTLDQWYQQDPASGRTAIRLPDRLGDGGVRTQGPFFPIRPSPVTARLQGHDYQMYDFTAQQYHSLARLTATLCQVLPNIRCDYPRNEHGDLILEKLDDETLAHYQGLLGHFHIQQNKIDPGPAFQWNRLVTEANQLMNHPPVR